MYHVSVHTLAERLLVHIRRQELLKAGDRVGVAVSGGIDSVALLRLLFEVRAELGIVLSVVHFNHKLRGAESDADQEFVAALAREHGLEFFVEAADVKEHAAEGRVSVEMAARELRYGFFRRLLGSEEISGAKAPFLQTGLNHSAESAAPPKSDPQELKPFAQKNAVLHGPEGPLFHGGTGDADSTPAFQGTPSHQNRAPDRIVTGHTLDDQAETVLMRMIRGAGLRGLGGIFPRIPVEDGDDEVCGEIVRPLLGIRRRELEEFLSEVGQTWREDSTNADPSLTRNRVRKLLVPLLEKEFNPAVAKNLAELAEIAHGEEDYWENEAAGWMGTVVHWSAPEWARGATSNELLIRISGAGPQELKPSPLSGPIGTAEAMPFPDLQTLSSSLTTHDSATRRSPRSLSRAKTALARDANPWGGEAELQSRIAAAASLVMNAAVDRLWFLGEPVAAQRRLVKAIGEHARIPMEFKHVEEILHFAAEGGPSGKELSLPLGWKLRRESHELIFVTPDLRGSELVADYEYELLIPGEVTLAEARLIIEVRRISPENTAGHNSDQLLDAESVRGPLWVRNWHPGDRFWPAHTKAPKKVKEILQERHVPQPGRKLWPVVVGGDEIVWVRGCPVSIKHRAAPGREAILIEEKPFRGKSTA